MIAEATLESAPESVTTMPRNSATISAGQSDTATTANPRWVGLGMNWATSKSRSGIMTPTIAHDHKYFFFSLVTAYGLHATSGSSQSEEKSIRCCPALLDGFDSQFGQIRWQVPQHIFLGDFRRQLCMNLVRQFDGFVKCLRVIERDL